MKPVIPPTPEWKAVLLWAATAARRTAWIVAIALAYAYAKN